MKTLILTATLASLAAGLPAFAADEINVSNGISAAGEPLAVHGSDTVALLETGKPQEGSAEFSYNHDGASYYFANAENLEKFKANPAKYTPEHGGFCSYGVSVGKKFDGDPDQFVIHDGKLFLFLNAATRNLFLEDVVGVRKTADQNWSDIKHIAVGEL